MIQRRGLQTGTLLLDGIAAKAMMNRLCTPWVPVHLMMTVTHLQKESVRKVVICQSAISEIGVDILQAKVPG